MNYEFTCRAVRENLGAYIDGELDSMTSDAIKRHLSTCAECKAEYEALLRITDMTEKAALTPPPDLHDAVRARIAVIKNREKKRRFRSFATGAVAVICVMVVVSVLLSSLFISQSRKNNDTSPSDEEQVTREGVSGVYDNEPQNNTNNSANDYSKYSIMPSYVEYSGKSGANITYSFKIVDRYDAVCRISDSALDTDIEYVGTCRVNSDNSVTVTMIRVASDAGEAYADTYSARLAYNAATNRITLLSGALPTDAFILR